MFEVDKTYSKDLEKAAEEYIELPDSCLEYSDGWEEKSDWQYIEKAFKAGAKWQVEQFEKERLKHCDELTEEQAQTESDFVLNHLKKNKRTPTFIDAIEYGMKLKEQQILENSVLIHL